MSALDAIASGRFLTRLTEAFLLSRVNSSVRALIVFSLCPGANRAKETGFDSSAGIWLAVAIQTADAIMPSANLVTKRAITVLLCNGREISRNVGPAHKVHKTDDWIVAEREIGPHLLI